MSRSPTCPVAELERRFHAFAIDRLLGWGLAAGVGAGVWLLSDDAWSALGLAAVAMVVVWSALTVVLGLTGTSPGKSLMGLRVVHHGTGTPIGVGRALLRSTVLALASLPTFALGLVTLAWTAVEDRGRQRRGWHDHLAHSIVVDVRPVEQQVEEVDHAPRHVVNLTAMRLIPAPPVDAPTPSRRSNPEQSGRRTPVPTQGPATSAPYGSGRPSAGSAPAPAAAGRRRAAGPPDPAPLGLRQTVPGPDRTARAASPAPGEETARRAGASLPEDGRTVARPRPGVPSGPQWRVTFDNGETFVVEGLALVGRRPEPRSGEQVHHLVPLTSADMSVSKTHAQFGPATDGALVVMDRGSTNGSVLVRRGVTKPLAAGKPATLVEGDTVTFGDRQMTVSREA